MQAQAATHSSVAYFVDLTAVASASHLKRYENSYCTVAAA